MASRIRSRLTYANVISSLALFLVRVVSSCRSRNLTVGTDGSPPPGQPERRKTPRRGGRAVKVLISDAAAAAKPIVGWVQNRSAGGLCLTVSKQFEVGEILSVRAAQAKISVPWLQVEVKYCFLREDEWLAGCNYVSVPPWNILLLFD